MVVSMERWKGKLAVVTGSSTGIGAAIAEQLVESGLKVVGLARRKEKLEEVAKKLESKTGKFYPFSADITKEEDVITAFQWTINNVGPIHILINNAGVARSTTLLDGDTKMWKEVLDTNVLGLCVATREAVKHMQANDVEGHIIHMNSVLGHTPVNFPKTNCYPASKYAVTALTETLRQELNRIGSKIKITSISPGFVATEILDTSGVPKEEQELLKSLAALQVQDVADAVVYILATPPHVQVHELIIKPVGEQF